MTEEQLHRQICTYLKLKGVLFNTDLSGIKMSIGQARKIKNLRSSRGFPDIVIYEPKNGYHGLFLEVKKNIPFKKNGELKSDKHLQEQMDMIGELESRGYKAYFVWDFDQAKKIIDTYL